MTETPLVYVSVYGGIAEVLAEGAVAIVVDWDNLDHPQDIEAASEMLLDIEATLAEIAKYPNRFPLVHVADQLIEARGKLQAIVADADAAG